MGANFVPAPGQKDYTHTRRAPVVNCIVQYRDKVLIVKRSSQMGTYPGLWNGISGFLDDDQSPVAKAFQEVREETGFERGDIIGTEDGPVMTIEDKAIGKIWDIHPVLVRVRHDRVSLDWEASEYKWVIPGDISAYECVPGFFQVCSQWFDLS